MSLDAATDEELGAWFDGVLENARSQFPGEAVTVSYGATPEQVIDLWGDTAAPLLVISIHGGYFAAAYDRTVNEPLSRRLVQEGCLVANIEYRRAGSCNDPQNTIADVRTAIRWILDHSGTGQMAILIGHSAGGYLALKASVEPGLRAVLPISPVTQLTRSARLGVDDGAIADWVGASPDEDAEAWELLELTRDALPDIPIFLIHGSLDTVVPFADSFDFANGGNAQNRTLGIIEIQNCGHYEFLDPHSAATDTLVEQITRLR